MASLLPLILLALLCYGLTTVLTLFLIRYFHLRLRLNPYIFTPFMMLEAFLFTIMLGLVSMHIMSTFSGVLFFIFLVIISIPMYIFARRYGTK